MNADTARPDIRVPGLVALGASLVMWAAVIGIILLVIWLVLAGRAP